MEALSTMSSQALACAGPLRARRFFFGGLAVGILVMSAVAMAVAALADSPRDVVARSAAPAPSVLTATARWHVLTDPIIVTGVVTAARMISVTAKAPFGVVTVTKMPVRPGDRVRPGHVIAEVDGRPILLLAGSFPAYRDLHVGDSGPDVTQLHKALEGVGYADFDPDGVFGPSTALALTLLYRHLGYAAPLYHPHHPRHQRGRASSQAPSAYLPMGEVTFVPGRSAFVVSVNAQVGTIVRGEPIMRLATGRPFVAGELSGYQVALARRGMAVRITSASPALKAKGRLARIGKLASPGGGAGSGTGGTGAGGSATTQYPIDVRFRRPLPLRLIGTTVRLTLAPPLTTGPVLLVPVAAIFGPSSQQVTHVIEIAADGRRDMVAVFTGPAAGGLVAVRSVRAGALRPGNRVMIGIGGRP
jgi:multidrug efflux pump subunit AcrA (membrane-fusion protein)